MNPCIRAQQRGFLGLPGWGRGAGIIHLLLSPAMQAPTSSSQACSVLLPRKEFRAHGILQVPRPTISSTPRSWAGYVGMIKSKSSGRKGSLALGWDSLLYFPGLSFLRVLPALPDLRAA